MHRDKGKENETHDEEMEGWETKPGAAEEKFFLSSLDETHDEEIEV